jgi:hypothetical protein
MNTSITELVDRLRDDLGRLRQLDDPRQRYYQAIRLTEETIHELHNLLTTEDLSDAEQIELKKRIKPEIDSYRIEEGLRYHLFVNRPVGTTEVQRRYYEEAALVFQNFFRMNAFYHQYFKSGSTELDKVCFLDGDGIPAVPIPEIPDADYTLSTPLSFLFARFMAYERLQEVITFQISRLSLNASLIPALAGPDGVTIRWTGEVVNIVELAYGLWLTGQLNDGNVSLNEIVKWLEVHFQVSIGIVQRRFSEIERRKRFPVTKFLDRMKDSILKKINDGHA